MKTMRLKPKHSFEDAVHAIVAKIPRGKTMTYGEVARAAGRPRAYRAVGNIMNKNHDPKIPCHRVVGANGIGGYNGGVQKKIALLKSEGVNFRRSRKNSS